MLNLVCTNELGSQNVRTHMQCVYPARKIRYGYCQLYDRPTADDEVYLSAIKMHSFVIFGRVNNGLAVPERKPISCVFFQILLLNYEEGFFSIQGWMNEADYKGAENRIFDLPIFC
jgi:hypothetical protein